MYCANEVVAIFFQMGKIKWWQNHKTEADHFAKDPIIVHGLNIYEHR